MAGKALSPSTEVKFETLAEGLEVSIMKISELRKYSYGHFLLAPDFYRKDKLKMWRFLNAKSNQSVTDYFLHIKDTITKINQKAIYYDLTNALSKFVEQGKKTEKLKSAKKVAQAGDLVISRLRSYLEEMGIVEENERQQLFSSEFLVFRAKTDRISTSTLFAFCMTESVQLILQRSQYGTQHPRFYNFILENLPLPDSLFSIDKQVKTIIQTAHQKRAQARQLYHAAEQILSEELGLLDYKPKQALFSTVRKKIVDEVKRFDAEYFQPKYQEIIELIEGYRGGWDYVENILDFNTDSFLPKDDKFYSYIPLSNVFATGEIQIPKLKLGQELPSRARRKVKAGEVILASVTGSLETSALIGEIHHDYIVSNGFHVFSSRRINSETLLLLFKSKIMLDLLKRISSGTILSSYDLASFKTLKLPLILPNFQTEIAKKVRASHRLRQESKALLEAATRKVEAVLEKE